MAKQRLPKIVSPKGVAKFPHLATPDEYKGKKEYKTELILNPADPGVAEFIAKIDEEGQKAFDKGVADLQARIDSGELKGKKLKDAKDSLESMELWPPYESEYDDAGEETGNVIIKTKALAEGEYKSGPKKGEKWERNLPIFDSAKQKLDRNGLRLWSGSVIRVQCEMNPYFMTATDKGGISLRLFSVQVIELKGGGDSADGFGVEDGYVGEQEQPSSGNDYDDAADAGGSDAAEEDF